MVPKVVAFCQHTILWLAKDLAGNDQVSRGDFWVVMHLQVAIHVGLKPEDVIRVQHIVGATSPNLATSFVVLLLINRSLSYHPFRAVVYGLFRNELRCDYQLVFFAMVAIRYVDSHDEYRTVRKIASSYLSIVELVLDQNGQQVVRKRLKNSIREDDEDGEDDEEEDNNDGFEDEVNITDSLRHHHIIRIHDAYIVDDDDDAPEKAFIMKQVAQGSLAQLLRDIRSRQRPGSTGPMNPSDHTLLRNAFGCLAATLHFTHSRHVRHKDLKPLNVLHWVDERGTRKVILTDFGIARADCKAADLRTRSRQSGTGHYAPPEWHENKERSVRSDIFSLGCIYLEILNALYPTRGLARCIPTNTEYYVNIRNIQDVLGAVARNANYDRDFRALVWLTHNMLSRRRDDRPDAQGVLNQILRLEDSASYICRECVPTISSVSGSHNPPPAGEPSGRVSRAVAIASGSGSRAGQQTDEAVRAIGARLDGMRLQAQPRRQPAQLKADNDDDDDDENDEEDEDEDEEDARDQRRPQYQQGSAAGNYALAGQGSGAYGLRVRQAFQAQPRTILQAMSTDRRFIQLQQQHRANNTDIYEDPRLVALLREFQARGR